MDLSMWQSTAPIWRLRVRMHGEDRVGARRSFDYLAGGATCRAGSLPKGLLASPAGARSQLMTSTVAPMANAHRNNFIQRSGRFSALGSSCALMVMDHSLASDDGCRTRTRAFEAGGQSERADARKREARRTLGPSKKGPRKGGPKGWAHPDQKKNRFSKRHPIGRAEFAISRRVRNVMDHLSAFTGGTQCCQSQRAAPAIL